MQELFTSLTRAVESTPLIAIGAAFIWGILSIILSPCHVSKLPSINFERFAEAAVKDDFSVDSVPRLLS